MENLLTTIDLRSEICVHITSPPSLLSPPLKLKSTNPMSMCP